MRELVRGHWPFLLLLACGIGLRVVTTLAYRPALFFVDSQRYLGMLAHPDPAGTSPLGYSYLVLWPALHLVHDLTAAAVANHLLGLFVAVGGYVLLLRWEVRPWLAALATVPVLLDAYQLQIEQLIMSDTLFEALLLLVLLVLARRRPPGHVAAVAGGVVLAAAGLTRLVGLGCGIVAVAYLLVAGGPRLRRVTTSLALVAGLVVPLAGYAAYYHAWHGVYRLSRPDSTLLYARVAPFADCTGMSVPSYERVLCESRPPSERPGPDYYHWDPNRPTKRLDPPQGVSSGEATTDFTHRVIRHQPLDFAGAVAHAFLRGFSWTKTTGPGEPSVARWQFRRTEYHHSYPVQPYIDRWGGPRPYVQPALAAFLVDYQQVAFTRGTYMGAFLVLALLGAAGVGRARRSGLRAVTAFAAALPGTALVVAAVFEFTWRYQLPGVVLLPFAGALGVTALTRRPPAGASAPAGAAAAAGPDPTDEVAVREFEERYPNLVFQPVVVLVAAYDEAAGIGAVLDSVPAHSCGLGVDRLVVDDGSTDDTGEVAEKHGAYVCRPPRNRGQGAALRLGYRLARQRGARYVVTTDADGQYDMAELPLLLRPLLAGDADFVTGSRTLGRHESDDLVRKAGTRVFAALVSALTGTRVTDTSFGFRAMRAEVTGDVILAQPQYQSAELLIGLLARGYRVREQPMTMRDRRTGSTKKGNNLVYARRYLGVVLSTWLRERGRPRNSRSSSRNRTMNKAP